MKKKQAETQSDSVAGKTKAELLKEVQKLRTRVKKLEKSATSLKNDSTELFELRQLFPLVLNTIQQSVFWKDVNSRFLGCNKLFAIDAGLKSPDEIIGKTDHDFNWKDRIEEYIRDDKFVMDSRKPKLNYIERQTKPDGSIRWLKTNKVPLIDKTGNVYGVLGSYEDITERKLNRRNTTS